MKKKIVNIVNNLTNNGITNVIYNYCSKINKNNYEIVIVAGLPKDKKIIDKFEKENIKVKIINYDKLKNPIKYYSNLKYELKREKPDAVHIHGNSAVLVVEELISKIAGINKRFIHVHSTNSNHNFLHKLLKRFLNKLCTYGIACSKEAGDWIFNKEYLILRNSFETDKFLFDYKHRNEIRMKYNIPNNAILIGHVGLFNDMKNHRFMLEFFEKLYKINHNYFIMFVGDGELFQNIKEYVNGTKYKDNVIFTGLVYDVKKYYDGMDIFVFPSKYEGFGISLVEAQINGLPCYASNFVPQMTAMTKNIKFLPIDDSNIWVDNILNSSKRKKIQLSEFNDCDINVNVKKLEDIYKKYI